MKLIIETDDALDQDLIDITNYKPLVIDDQGRSVPNPVSIEEHLIEDILTSLENRVRQRRLDLLKQQAEAALQPTLVTLANYRNRKNKA